MVEPIPFILPHYEQDPYARWQLALGLTLYDFLGRHGAMPKHWALSKEQVCSILPGIREEGLQSGFCYFDGQMNDVRLLIENLLAAEEAGALVFNYSPVKELIIERGSVTGLYVQIPFSNESQKIEAKQVVNATGAWSNQVATLEPGISKCFSSPNKGVPYSLKEVGGRPSSPAHTTGWPGFLHHSLGKGKRI